MIDTPHTTEPDTDVEEVSGARPPKKPSKKLIAIITASALVLTGGATLTAVSIASAANQSKVDSFRTAETTYNSVTAKLNTANAATPDAITRLTTSIATGTQHIAELQKLSAAESAFSPESRTTITEILPTVTAALPDAQEATKFTTVSTEAAALAATQLKQEPKIADPAITEEKTTQLTDKTKKLEATLATAQKQIEDWAKSSDGIAKAITDTLPALIAAAQSSHAAAGALIEATPAATPESQQAVLDALAAIDATSVISGAVTTEDATLEDTRGLSAALSGYVDSISARGESHVAGVNAAAEAAAAEAAAQQNEPTYTAPDGSQKPNPKHNPQAPSGGNGSGNPGGGSTGGSGSGNPGGSGSGTPPAPTTTTYSADQQIANSGYGGNALSGECAALNTAYVSNTNPTIGGPIGLGGARLGWTASSGASSNSVTWYAC